MELRIPKLSLVVLIGPSGSGKSMFARKHFLKTEVLSSDACRALVSDDQNDQTVTKEAFEVLHFIAAKRLTARPRPRAKRREPESAAGLAGMAGSLWPRGDTTKARALSLPGFRVNRMAA